MLHYLVRAAFCCLLSVPVLSARTCICAGGGANKVNGCSVAACRTDNDVEGWHQTIYHKLLVDHLPNRQEPASFVVMDVRGQVWHNISVFKV